MCRLRSALVRMLAAPMLVGILAAPMLVGILAATALAAGELTLEDALARAHKQHPTLRAAAAVVEAARIRLGQARKPQANPVVALELARHTAPGEAMLDRGVSVSQEVEVGGQWGLRVQSAEHELARAEHQAADRERAIAAEVRRAFAGVIAAERRAALAHDTATIAARLLDTVRRRVRAGDAGDLDERLAEIQSTQAAQGETLAVVERARATARLASAIGADATEPLGAVTEAAAPSGTDAAERPPSPSSPRRAPSFASLRRDELVTRALASRPDLAASREERAHLETEAQLTRRHGRVPNPVLQGFYREELANEHIAGGAIAVPFPIWNRDEAAEATALAAAAAASAEERRLLQEVPRQVDLALTRRDAAATAWARYEREALPAGDAARAAVERAYGAGYLGLTEALAQQDRLLQIRAAAITTWLDLQEADADLIEAVGGDAP